MLMTIGASVDRRMSLMLISRVRRRWPLLRLVPAAMMVPLLAPVARRARRSVMRATVVGLLAAGVAATVVLIAGWQ